MPDPGSEITVRLKVGEHFKGDAVARDPRRIVRFVATGPHGETPVEGGAGAEPAGRVRIAAGGLTIVSYTNNPAYLELEPGKFDSYLVEEGLEKIVQLRKERGEQEKRSRELYSRCAKSLLAAGGGEAAVTGHDRVLGLALELIPAMNPYAMTGKGPFEVSLLFRGKPVEGVLIVALNETDPARKLAGRTDAAGHARLDLWGPGVWLIKAVHMIASDGSPADWESFWASLTFRIPGGEGR